MNWLKRLIIGRPLENEALQHEKYSVFWGLPILSSDVISSVAYATEEILLVLIPAVGLLSYHYLSYISGAIILLLAILTVSYRQTIRSYPCGGGAYIVASDNLGTRAGVAAGAALALDYILTVAVSISSGVFNLASVFPVLLPYQVELAILFLLIIFIGNLRGISESSKLFGIPAYTFMFAIISMIVAGIAKVKLFGYVPPEPVLSHAGMEPLSLFLLLRAFSSGCAAVTGVEAVSNAVPNFKEPAARHAQKVLFSLSLVVLILFGGLTILANLYHVVPSESNSVLSQINAQIFGHSFMYYFVQFTTMVILALAANTAYADFPMLFSLMARDGFAPRQLSQRGERLSYSNGILVLTLVAALLIIAFRANVTQLIPLYAVGVFLSFTLSQTGMTLKWIRSREPGWLLKAAVNGLGALVTLVTVLVIGVTKFLHGAWIIIVVIPFLMTVLLKIKRHYLAVAEQLRLSPEELEAIDFARESYRNHVIVPVASVNRASVRALRYARTISGNVVAFNVATSPEAEERIREKWAHLNTDIPLVVQYSTYRKVIEPLLEFIESYELHNYRKGDMITVILPQFTVRSPWQWFLHNQSRLFIQRSLLRHKHIVVATMPLQLRLDREVLRDPQPQPRRRPLHP
ncbi:amino acid/polyamine/organocation transporter (APC superfamily) [Hydrogenispora ethanolica]|uniref:Amino acid/polyamine/organocation transporter (APC superfamily) n=1 Tax=Hydrogenispora ethanolica TaxID=1082276 RepID=A0A4R1SBG6_HYDET|nr:APC family permease [Hydrogenispora ethanolica]TCL76828.1 amino acid/polyamine/organocation transporter (APC superfamily) [Hydrogenispora ethanolica]